MANPFKTFPQSTQVPMETQNNIAQIKNMLSMLNGVQNPQMALNMLTQKNPQFASVLNLLKGKNPEQVFYELCKQKNINPESILSQLR